MPPEELRPIRERWSLSRRTPAAGKLRLNVAPARERKIENRLPNERQYTQIEYPVLHKVIQVIHGRKEIIARTGGTSRAG
jgi:hypothetical protein